MSSIDIPTTSEIVFKPTKNYLDHIRTLATLVPDEIIYRTTDQSRFNGVLLFVDVSGFTDMCEKYNSLGKGGPSKITQVLNSYIGAMVQEIMSHSGDIIKFSGDAFLALWKSSDDISMSDIVHASIDCALGIQRSHGTYRTEVGIILRVKIALAAGSITFSLVGNSNYMIIGKTMFLVKDLENLCNPGDIIIGSGLKFFLGLNEYTLENIDNSNNAKVLSIGTEWTPSSLGNQFELFDVLVVSEARNVDDEEEESDIVVTEDYDDKPSNYSYMLRPSLDYAAKNNMSEYLRKFIIPPVVRAVDLNEPLDYLTEMRQVVIVFINVVTHTTKIQDLIVICNDSYETVCEYKRETFKNDFNENMFYVDRSVVKSDGGFKHETETKKALYCALDIQTKLSARSNLNTVSIGVCTGITYCGVVGHPMRKEYTVIGRTVNKAARLMIAYPNMVTCDRQTFLQSFLQAKYFTLQPVRYLKGFKNVGPIYKFDDKWKTLELIKKEMHKTDKYPILGRCDEMQRIMYFLSENNISGICSSLINLPEDSKVNNDCSCLVFISAERMGKSRIFHEIAHCVTSDTDYCELRTIDIDKRFKIFRIMFSSYCNIKREKDITMRTKLVNMFMTPFKVPEFLCGLNDVLKVNFPVTKYYTRLSEEQKLFVTKKMIKYLCIKAYKRKSHLIVIDNIEFIDEDSWKILPVILNTKFVFIIATLGNYILGRNSKAFLARKDVDIMRMKPIDKIYHAGLICQFLNCQGISVELERYIQLHSGGNPGWIESFLKSLSDSACLQIIEMNKKEAHNNGIVIPTWEMLYRTPGLSSSSFKCSTEREGSFVKSLGNFPIEEWTIYHQSIKENDNQYTQISKKISICLTPSDINLETVDNEDIVDVKTIQIYDDLKVHEQLLLKCCSILGDSFSRAILEYVMQSHGELKNAEAIQKLFEIQVFLCARAKYVDGAIQIDHYQTDPKENKSVNCYCTGFPINPIIKNLPKYANCGYIQFREPTFRQMLCNLLTDNQASLYHIRAMWFLESNIRRCLACGLGYFITLVGQSNDDGMKKYSMDQFLSGEKTSFKSSTARGIFVPPLFNESIYRSRIGYNSIKDIKLNIPFIEKTTNIGVNSETRVRTFADNNLFNCQCQEILIWIYKQMIEHCQEAALNEKYMSAILEYATVCIKTKNTTVAFSLLEKATTLLNEKLKFEFTEPNWQVPLTKGKIAYLKGLLHLERYAFHQVEINLLTALKCYNLSFPSSTFGILKEIFICELKQKIIVEYFPHRYIGSKNDDICILAEQTSEVLSAMFYFYRRKLDFRRAYLASLWALNEAFRSDSNFAIMCTAYAHVIFMDLIYRRREIMPTIIDMALNMCYRKNIRLEKHELEAVIKLYGAIFCRKFLCENMLESLKIGSIVVKLNSPSFGSSYKWLMFPFMIRAFIFSFLISQAALLIFNLSHYRNCEYSFARYLYYIVCIEFRLYTTFSIESFVIINAKRNPILHQRSIKTYTAVEMMYYAALWVWHIRKNNWAEANALTEHIDQIMKWHKMKEPLLVYGLIHIVEGYLLIMVNKINFFQENDISKLKSNINALFKELDKTSKNLITLKSRCLLLKAYWYMIKNKERKAFELLDEAISVAKKCGALYDIDWIVHTRNLWLFPKPPNQYQDEWQTATDEDILDTDWESQGNERISIPFFNYHLPIK